MDLDFDPEDFLESLPAAPLQTVYVRELTKDDVQELPDNKGLNFVPIKTLRENHHRAAMFLAMGLKDVEVAGLCGYSTLRVMQLQKDPSFIELVAHYRLEVVEPADVDLVERMKAFNIDVFEELRTRFEADADQFDNQALMSLFKTFADRTGFGPQSKNTNINVNIGLAAQLESARKRVPPPRSVKEIEATVVPQGDFEIEDILP